MCEMTLTLGPGTTWTVERRLPEAQCHPRGRNPLSAWESLRCKAPGRGGELAAVCKGRSVTWDDSFLLCALPLTQKIIVLFMRGYVPTALLVLKSFISHGMSVSVPGKWSHIFRTSLQSPQKLKREKVVGDMEERGGRGMPEG